MSAQLVPSQSEQFKGLEVPPKLNDLMVKDFLTRFFESGRQLTLSKLTELHLTVDVQLV